MISEQSEVEIRILADIEQAEKSVRRAQDYLDSLYRQIRELGTSGLPEVDGWYVDKDGDIARRLNGQWDDGWGNGGPEFGYPRPPLRRLVPEGDQ